MTNLTQGIAYGHARDLIADAVQAGTTLEQLETEIDRLPLGRDARDALWLYAWNATERFRPRRRGVAQSVRRAPARSRDPRP